MTTMFAKLEARRRQELAQRQRWSAVLRQRLVERGLPLLRAYGVSQAWLFGSVASGTAGLGSDLDLLAVPVTAADYWPLRRDLAEALECPLDLYTQDDDPVFVRKVMERGERILEIQSRVVEGRRAG